MTEQEKPGSRFLGSWRVWLLLAVSIGIRIYIFAVMHPVVHTDSVTFFFLDELDMVRTPGYPLFLEALLSVNDWLGVSVDYLGVMVFGQIFVLGVLNAWLIYRIASSLTGSRGFALAAGLLYNLNYFVVGFEFSLLTETLSITLLLAVLALYLKLFSGRFGFALAAGGLSVLLVYTRATFMLLAVGLPVLTWLALGLRRDRRAWFRRYAPLLAVFLAVSMAGVFGWSLRNKLKFDYFGISSLMPYQLRYYTNPLFEKYRPTGNACVDAAARVYAEEFARTGPSSATVYNFVTRLNREQGMSDAQVATCFLKAQLRLLRDFPGEYIKKVPESFASYYRAYSPYWTAGNARKFLERGGIMPWLFRGVFGIHRELFFRPPLLLLLLLGAPAVVLIAAARDKHRLHGWLVLLAVIHYNGFVSILTTNAGINNLRYRQPVEPLILLFLYAALFFAGRALARRFKRPHRPPLVSAPPGPTSPSTCE